MDNRHYLAEDSPEPKEPTMRTARYRSEVEVSYGIDSREYAGDWRTTRAQAESDATTYIDSIKGDVIYAAVTIAERTQWIAPGAEQTVCQRIS